MMIDGNKIRYYEFGDFRLDAQRRRLTKGGEFVPITRRNFSLLLLLVENHGELLEHDEILEKVWEGLFVEQSNLKKGISSLRRVLEESPDQSYFIKTVPRRGYKFDAPVRALPDEDDGPDEEIAARPANAEIIIAEEREAPPAVESTTKSLARPVAEIPAKRRYSRLIAAVAAIILLFGAAALGLRYYFTPAPILFSAEKVNITKATSEGNLLGAVVSPDGSYLVYIAGERETRILRLKHVATGGVTEIARFVNAGLWCVNFSPDGNYIYYGVENFADPAASGLYKVSFYGGESRRLYNEPVTDLTFAPDGSRLAFAHKLGNLDVEIVTANPEGGDVRQLASYSPENHIDGLNWSPDSAALLITLRQRLSVGKAISRVGEISLAGGPEKIVVPDQEKQITSPVWLPGKKSLLMSVRDENAEIYRIWQFFPANGEWRRVVNDNNSYRLLSLSRDGQTLVSTREMRVAAISTAESGQSDFRQITDGAGGYDHLSWTRDGRIVYDTTETENTTLWVMDADGAHKKQLTGGKDGIRLFPQISGDGGSIIFNSNRTGTRQVWRIGLDGQNPSQLTSVETGASGGTLLSDNQTLIYETYIKPKGWTLYKQTADHDPVPLSTENVGPWSVSPDENLIAYAGSDEKTGKEQVFVRSLKNGELVKTLDIKPLRELRWTRDGKALAYLAEKDDTDQIIIQPLDGSPPKSLADFRSENIFQFDWSFDAAKLAVVRGRQLADAVIIKTEAEK